MVQYGGPILDLRRCNSVGELASACTHGDARHPPIGFVGRFVDELFLAQWLQLATDRRLVESKGSGQLAHADRAEVLNAMEDHQRGLGKTGELLGRSSPPGGTDPFEPIDEELMHPRRMIILAVNLC